MPTAMPSSIPGIGRLVVYTCITGDYDIPLESPWALRCPHLCFSDAPRLRSATWTHVPLDHDSESLDPVRRSRQPKLLPHRYLDAYDVSIWIDASARLLVDPVDLARRALDGASLAIPRH
ncbi:MAG: glycosyltransferase domain-containing protein, partial [Panacagrimonas sp.]